MILASGGDLHIGLYMWHMVIPVLFWNGVLALSYMDCCGVRMNNKIIFGNNLVRG